MQSLKPRQHITTVRLSWVGPLWPPSCDQLGQVVTIQVCGSGSVVVKISQYCCVYVCEHAHHTTQLNLIP